MLGKTKWRGRKIGTVGSPIVVRAIAALLAVAGVAMLALLHWAQIHRGWTPHTLFLANLGVVFLVAVGLASVTRRRERAAAPGPFPRWEVVAVVGLTVVGAFMRAAQWDVFPPADGQLLEEPQVAWNAIRSIRIGHLDAFFPIVNLIGEVGFRIFAPTMDGLRIPFVVIGILSVPIFHLAARSFLRSTRAALFVTALFATNSMLAGSSRIALETMHPIFTTVLAMAVTFHVGRRPTVGNCALAGACNGLLLTEYDSYRLVPVLGFIFLAMRFAVGNRGESPSTVATGWTMRLSCLLAFGLFVLSVELSRLLITDLHNPFVYLGEAFLRHDSYLSGHRAAMKWGQVMAEELDKLGTNLQYLFLQGERADILPPTMGHFDPYTGLMGACALGFCLLGAWWKPMRLFPVIAVMLLTILSTVLVGSPARYRLLPAIPYYLLSIGVPIEAIDNGWPRARNWLNLTLVIVAIGLAVVNVQRFFGVAIWDRQVQETFYDLSMVLSHEIAELQRRHPAAPITVLSDQVHLAVPNDYAFWYDYETVKVFPSGAAARGRTGYLLAHDRFIPKPEDLPNLRDCEQWTTRFDRNVLLRCRLARSDEPPAAGER